VGDQDALFSHYPSRLLQDDQALELTDVGRGRAPGEIGFARYEDVAVCLFPELETLILEKLDRKPLTIGEIKEIAARHLDASPGQALFHLLWLLKHGAVALLPEDPE
jgi:hypothetical protein